MKVSDFFGSYVLHALVLSFSLMEVVEGNAGLFTYYETPLFDRIGNKGVVMSVERAVGFGPSQWPNILFPPQLVATGNQCGGIGQATGYGQSPIVVAADVRDTCDVGLEGYEFEAGTCTWEDYNFRILTNGVIVGSDNPDCSLGRMKIPGMENWFNALQFHIHTSSEHSVDGTYYKAELHVVHQESNGESFAVFGMFLDEDPDDAPHSMFENFLQGWEARALQTEEYCAVNPSGTGEWGPNSAFTSRQMRIQCPAVGSTVDYRDEIVFEEETGLPPLKIPEYSNLTSTEVPHIYEDLPTPGYGIYTYRGGLTTPPCTEIVNWNLLDTPMFVSKSQMSRLYEIILCFTEPTTCRHATIANEAGQTNRPVQALKGRTVTHRCPDLTDEETDPVRDPTPPSFEFVETQHRRCILGGDGGPLQMCWVGEYHAHFAMIYPWFVMALGFVVYFILTRYVHILPYTAVMFFIGLVMGIFSVTGDNPDQLTASIRIWEDVDAETLLLAFLPGLLFRDAYSSNVFLFQRAFWQCVTMAFPMVLCGTGLTALVAYYILPYGWSWALSFTFGAILSATDPVAVSSLLNEVGAPPRLKILISGESLLNDGSAIVFFFIFSQLFFFEYGIPGFGTDVDLGLGFALFFRMCFGAVAVGLFYGASLYGLIFALKRRFSYEESVVQVTATITVAYLCYYTSEAVLGMSGVIAVVTLGVVTKFFTESLLSDLIMMEKFWTLVEHILNSLLFTLGGNVWGRIISNADPEHVISYKFEWQDLGIVFLVYFLMQVIRFLLVGVFYPVVSRIGLKSNWQEALFMAWGGLRGAVGIALAVALDKEVQHETLRLDPRRRFTTQLFFIVGGVAFLTLLINGTLAGPILKKLGLANLGPARHRIVKIHRDKITKKMFRDLLNFLGETRFSTVEWGHLKSYISFFNEMSANDIRFGVKQYKESIPVLDYIEPNLATFQPYLKEDIYEDIINTSRVDMGQKLKAVVTLARTLRLQRKIRTSRIESEEATASDEEHLIELRKVFVEILHRSYEVQFDRGEINTRDTNLVIAFKGGIEVMRDLVAQGNPIEDWDTVSQKTLSVLEMRAAVNMSSRGSQRKMTDLEEEEEASDIIGDNAKIKALVHLSTGFIQAHKRAQAAFKDQFCSGKILSFQESQILEESNSQIELATQRMNACGRKAVEKILSNLLCSILLSRAAEFVTDLTLKGMLHDQEAEHLFEEIEECLHRVGKAQRETYSQEREDDKLLGDNTKRTSADASLQEKNSDEMIMAA